MCKRYVGPLKSSNLHIIGDSEKEEERSGTITLGNKKKKYNWQIQKAKKRPIQVNTQKTT